MPSSPPSPKHRVMVVEDDPDARLAVCDVLAMHGYEVTFAGNGREALEKLGKATVLPEVILLDLRMPVMDGWEFRARQKKLPAIAGIPVVAISADGTAQAAAIDAAHFLAKPFDASAIVDAVRAVIRGASEESERARRLTDARADRLAAIGTLAAGAAHEINNPLAFVSANLGFAEEELADVLSELDRGPLTPELRTRLDEVRQSLAESRQGTARVQQIVRGLKTFSRADEDSPEAPVDVNLVLDGVIRNATAEIAGRALVLRELAPVPTIRGHAAQLSQVFQNLLLNAVQALPSETPSRNRITVRTALVDADQVKVEVEDNGPGIAPELQEKIFEPFFTTKPVGEGTGLGLSVSLGLVQAQGGALTVESTPGQGSIFRVLLPVWVKRAT